MTADRDLFYIRRLREDDSDRLSDYLKRLESRDRPDEQKNTALQLSSQNELERPDCVRYLAVMRREGREVFAGMLTLSSLDRPEVLAEMHTAADFQFKGVGSLLLRHAEDTACALGKDSVLLHTPLSDYHTQGILIRMGYVSCGTKAGGPAGNRREDYVMRRVLQPL